MKTWLVTTDDDEYDMFQAAIIVADSKIKAEMIAWAGLTQHKWGESIAEVDQLNFDGFGKPDALQEWHAEEIKPNKEKIVWPDFNAG